MMVVVPPSFLFFKIFLFNFLMEFLRWYFPGIPIYRIRNVVDDPDDDDDEGVRGFNFNI